jgi:hypothetical protein
MANNGLFEVSSKVLINDVQLSAVALVDNVWSRLAGRPVVLVNPCESPTSRSGLARADDAAIASERVER